MRLRVVVAWAKRSGLQRAESDLRTISTRGGCLELVVGISEGGATRQGLEIARDIFDSVYIAHDRSGRTFHPKLYLADGVGQAVVMIGSNNLTAGGMYFNYEVGSILELDLDDDDDRKYFEAVESLIGRVMADRDICVKLTDGVLAELLSNARYDIRDEDTSRRSQFAGAPEDLDGDVDIEDAYAGFRGTVSIFGKSQVVKKPTVSILSGKSYRSSQGSHGSRRHVDRVHASSAVVGEYSAVTELRWYKKMSNSDAQQRRTPNTQVTGNLKLTEARLPVNHRTFFRYVFFGDCNWAGKEVNRGIKEEAVVPFHVTADGGPLGTYSLKIDHAEYRVASQGNVPTWLHWGNDLSQYLRDNGHVDDYVTLERREDGEYTLTISEEPIGDFLG